MSQLLKSRSGNTTTRSSRKGEVPAANRAVGTRNSRRVSLVFEVLLGAAACLALIGVVQASAEAPAGAPDAKPPAIFVQTD